LFGAPAASQLLISVICAEVTQVPYVLGMLPPSIPQRQDCDESTSAELDALEPGVMYPALTKPV
jgi:hypothetical protein